MKNNIDDFFKDGLSQNEFEYNEETWQGFMNLYEAEKEDDPIVIPFLTKTTITGALVLLVILGLLYFISGNDYNKAIVNDSAIDSPINNNTNVNLDKNVTHESISDAAKSIILNKDKSRENKEDVVSTINELQKKAKISTSNNNNTVTNKTSANEISSTYVVERNDSNPTSLNPTISSTQNKLVNKVALSSEKEVTLKTTTTIQTFSTLPTLAIGIMEHRKPYDLESDFRTKTKKRLTGKFFLVAAAGLGNMDNKNYEFGLGKKFVIGNHFGMNIGVKYRSILAPTLPRHRGFDTKYSRSDQTFFGNHIEADQMHFAAIPISLEATYKRHHLNLGVTYNRLFLVRGTIHKDIGNIEESHAAWIVETGLNLNLFSTNLSYGYQLNPSTQLFLNAEMFLTDTYNNDVTVSHKFNNFNLGLKYYLNSFRKNQTLLFL